MSLEGDFEVRGKNGGEVASDLTEGLGGPICYKRWERSDTQGR